MSGENPPAGWYRDPTGQHHLRYYNGSAWTEHVTDASAAGEPPPLSPPPSPTPPPLPTPSPSPQSPPSETPPLAASSAPPPPHGPSGPSAVGASAGVEPLPPVGDPAASRAVSTARSFLDSLGDDAVERPSPDLPAALGGIGGLFLGLGIVVLVGQSGGRGVIVLGGLVALAAAYLVAFFALERVPFLRTPAVSMTVVAIFAIAIGLLIGDDGDLTSDRAASVAILLGGVACLGAWIAPGLRGRPFLLGTGLVAVPFGVAGLLAGGEPCEGFECSAFEETAGTTGLNTVSAIVLCLVGGALLALVWKLDEWGKAGLATTVAAACILNLGLGAVGLAADLGDTGGASLIAIAGSALGIVGHLRARRGLTWTGAALAGGSLAYVVIDTANPGSGTGAGFVLVLTGVIVAGTPRLVMLIRDSESNRPGGPPPES